MPLMLGVPYAVFQRALEGKKVPGGALYYVKDVPDVAAANRLMELVLR